jgi:TonB family protein
MVIDPQFDEAGNFSGGLALVRVGVELREFGPIEKGRLAYIDETGKYVWPKGENVPIVPFWRVEEKPRPVNIPVPTYPDSVRTAGIEGQVVILALVNVDGSIADTRIHWSSGNASLDQAAVDAAMRAEFTPGRQRGSPVRVWAIVPFRFPPK